VTDPELGYAPQILDFHYEFIPAFWTN
jgi:hypothetical protein